MKTAHEWAVELAHERISYGLILEGQPDVLKQLKNTIFRVARDLIEEAQRDARYPEPPPDPKPGEHQDMGLAAPEAR